MKVSHYEALLLDFGVDKQLFSETRNGKVLRLKAKDLADYFWSRADVVERYHNYQDGDSESSYDEVQTSSDEDAEEKEVGHTSDTHTHTHTHTHTYHTHRYIHTCMHILCMYTRTHTQTHIRGRACIHADKFMHTHIQMYSRTQHSPTHSVSLSLTHRLMTLVSRSWTTRALSFSTR